MLTNIDIDEHLVAEAMRLSGARTKREVVDRALREMVARATRPSIRELFGIGGVESGYDPKAPWAHGQQSDQFRVEEPRAAYGVRPAASRSTAPREGTPARVPPPKSAGRKAVADPQPPAKAEPPAKADRRSTVTRKR
jgi:hypothetical protein